MTPFVAPVEDILFSLQHVAGVGRLADWDDDLCPSIIQHFAEFAEGEIAPVDEIGDRTGCRLKNGQVQVPEVYQDVFRNYVEQGWPGLTIAQEYGGQGMGASVLSAVSEIYTGACHALQMSCGLLPGAARTLMEFATEQQKRVYLPLLANGSCLSTMCLTEPNAGSDLSSVRTTATRSGTGWRLNGEKIFISGGGQNLSENILHLVLARSGSLQEGVKGLSLFVCLNQIQEGVSNGISVTRIEEKMGIHGSPTCQLRFDNTNAELIGTEGEGLKAMFTMMNHARLDVALQGVAHAARSHNIALAYASERRQGRRADGVTPAFLTDHADVERMLNTQDALAIGARALCHETLVILESGAEPALVEFLTPVCKVFCTQAGIQSADLGIQILGGYGYLKEYRIEQTLRDARISAIYEGANGIHCMTLATRLLKVNQGACANAFEAHVMQLAEKYDQFGSVRYGLMRWAEARCRLVESDNPGASAHAFMQLTATLFYHAIWKKIETVRDNFHQPRRLQALASIIDVGIEEKYDYWAKLIS